MPVIRVSMYAGRSLEQKRQLVRKLTDAVVEVLGASEERTIVYLDEHPKDTVAVGGTLAVDSERPGH